jgi:hypothetical protein
LFADAFVVVFFVPVVRFRVAAFAAIL